MRRPLAAITGGTGFLGRHVTRALAAQGWDLRLLVRPQSRERRLDLACDTTVGDLADETALRALVRGATAIVHVAGLVKARRRDDFFRANAAGSERLGRIIRAEAPGSRLIVVSSLAARAPHLSDYAASKRAGEEAAVATCGAASTVILRPTAVYGPGDRESLLVFRAARALLIVPATQGRVTLLHVEDMARAVAAMAAHLNLTGTFELTDGRWRGYTWDEIAGAAAGALGRRPRVLRVPAALLRAVAPVLRLAPYGAEPRLLTRDKLREILHDDWSSTPAAQPPAAIWQPRISLGPGFCQTAQWYVENGWMAPAGRAG